NDLAVKVNAKPAPPPTITILFHYLLLLEDEESGDTHMAIYIYQTVAGGESKEIYRWNNCGNKVNETNTYHIETCGIGSPSVVSSDPVVLDIDGYTHDDNAWPDSQNHENNLGSTHITIYPTQSGTIKLDTTTTDNNHRGFTITVEVSSP